MPLGDTICAIATGPAEGAIGIVRLSGPAALALLGQVCEGAELVPRRLGLRALRDPRSGELLERALVCYLPGPRSYSGEDMVEVQAHGGLLNLDRLLRLFVELGARPALPGEFTRRAFLNCRLDLSQAEAVAEVIGARSERALRNAQALLGGALGERLRPLRQELLTAAALLESEIDFADEVDAGPGSTTAMLERLSGTRRSLEELAGTYRTGRHLDGARVGLVGAVNAGKSSLFNRLLGTARALVSAEPGTTRDYLEAEVTWAGSRLVLVDAAGWRAASEQSALERAGEELALGALRSCDLLLEIVDLTAPSPAAALAALPEVPRLRVGNKVDLLDDRRRGALSADELLVSALTGEGLETLRARLSAELFGSAAEETVLVSRQRHWHALRRTADAVAEAETAQRSGLPPELVVEHLRAALQAIGEITGEGFSEAVLDQVFERFCIGK